VADYLALCIFGRSHDELWGGWRDPCKQGESWQWIQTAIMITCITWCPWKFQLWNVQPAWYHSNYYCSCWSSCFCWYPCSQGIQNQVKIATGQPVLLTPMYIRFHSNLNSEHLQKLMLLMQISTRQTLLWLTQLQVHCVACLVQDCNQDWLLLQSHGTGFVQDFSSHSGSRASGHPSSG